METSPRQTKSEDNGEDEEDGEEEEGVINTNLNRIRDLPEDCSTCQPLIQKPWFFGPSVSFTRGRPRMYAGGGPTTLSILRNSQQSDNLDKFGQPKGFTYVEFIEVEAVQNALLLNESELHGRQLKVSAKRTNVLGMKQFRGRRPNSFYGFTPQRPYMPGPLSIRHMDMGVCF